MKELVFGEWIPIADYDLYEEAYKKAEDTDYKDYQAELDDKDRIRTWEIVASFEEGGWCHGAFAAWKEGNNVDGEYFMLPTLERKAQETLFGTNDSFVEDIIAEPITHFMFVKSPSIKK